MEFIRFRMGEENYYGIVEGERINRCKGDIFKEVQPTDDYYDLDEVDLLAPVEPEKVVCIGLNYLDHAKEMDLEIPKEPVIFLKPPTAVVGPGEVINYPKSSSQLDYEAELAVVIKDEIKDIPKEKAANHILGYTCFNDVTARDLQAEDGQWTRAKSFDTFAPLGPKIISNIDPSSLEIEAFLNGEKKQDSNTEKMIFSVFELVSFVSKIMTLKPGDVIATGTPPGVGEMKSGDEIEIAIEGIGSLVNVVE